MNQLYVKTSKLARYALIGLSIFFIPAALWLIWSSVSGGFRVVPLGLAAALLTLLALVAWISTGGHSRSVDVFTDEGLRTNGGTTHLWSNLSQVVDKMSIDSSNGTRKLWRTEIRFTDGSSAWLIPLRIINYSEVRAYVEALKCERVQEDA